LQAVSIELDSLDELKAFYEHALKNGGRIRRPIEARAQDDLDRRGQGALEPGRRHRMQSERQREHRQRERRRPQHRPQHPAAVGREAGLGRLRGGGTAGRPLPAIVPSEPGHSDVHRIGELLFGTYWFPVQIVGVLLLAATVGVVVLSKKELK
jgi:hypothetical protein